MVSESKSGTDVLAELKYSIQNYQMQSRGGNAYRKEPPLLILLLKNTCLAALVILMNTPLKTMLFPSVLLFNYMGWEDVKQTVKRLKMY